MKLQYLAIGAMIFGLAGCATTPVTTASGTTTTSTASPVQQAVAKVQSITVADLQAADADALAQTPPDALADQCYKGLIPFVQTGGLLPNPGKPVGIASAFQAGRDVAKSAINLSNGLTAAQRTQLAQACGPLALDSVTDINGVLTKIGIGTISTSLLPAGL